VTTLALGLNHASCADYHGYSLLILGASGSGKSTVLVELMALGATLVSDDQTDLFIDGDRLCARAPDRLSGLVEIRGVGIVPIQSVQSVGDIQLVVDLDRPEPKRMPHKRTITIGSKEIALILGADRASLGAQLFVLMKNRADLLLEPNV
jgi:HPr kinase/phosphorylase